ncbi:MAG: hypothetical protein ACP5I1_08020 [Candidatus Hinthialibacter sp.]
MTGLFKKVVYGIISIIIILIIAGGAWFIANHTIIKTDKEYVFAKKESMSFENNYVDVREWGVSEYIEHPEIAQALIEAGYQDIQESLENSEVKAKVDEAIEKTGEALQSITDQIKQ